MAMDLPLWVLLLVRFKLFPLESYWQHIHSFPRNNLNDWPGGDELHWFQSWTRGGNVNDQLCEPAKQGRIHHYLANRTSDSCDTCCAGIGSDLLGRNLRP